MGLWDMIAFVVVAGCLTGVITEYLKTKRTVASGNEDELEKALYRIEGLEDRIRTLETIVTDGKYNLGQQIDALKD